MTLQDYMAPLRDRVETTLLAWTEPSESTANQLVDAMRYSLLNGGKRIRPVLAYAASQAIGSINTATDSAAAALECIHTYSLIHDDLPAMDDDDLRRGKPTCHIAFDEATAILAGDALQTLAFEKLTEIDDATIAISLVKALAVASGDKGMVAGQMIDLLSEGKSETLSLEALEKVHRHKTGALIQASVLMGAISAGASQVQLDNLKLYAEAIGLAFQVQDDIIDVTSDTATLGKTQGADIAKGKSTYVSLLGLAQAKEKALKLRDVALEALLGFDDKADPLRWIADFIVLRDR